MLIPFDAHARITLGIVALGTPQRLVECLDSLAAHDTRHEFSVICVVNPATADASVALDFTPPPGVHVVFQEINVGWPGGLHVVRSLIHSELLVWVQEDMTVCDGWLDALVAAADEHPEYAAFGSCSVDAEGNATGVSHGQAVPPHDIRQWKLTEDTTDTVPNGVTRADWVTSKGMLVRLSAWDEIGGPNPTYYPLNHVDHDYCAHLGAHGYDVAIVSEARLVHLGSQSAPSMFRRFIGEYRDPAFNATWGPVLAARAAGALTVEHECKPWFPGTTQTDDPVGQIRAIAGAEASLMLIAFAKWAQRFTDAGVEHQKNVDNHEHSLALAAIETRKTGPLRAVLQRLRRPR